MDDEYLSDEEWHRAILAFLAAGIQPVSEIFSEEPLIHKDLSDTPPLSNGESVTLTFTLDLDG
jgi:hypothetical protein